MKGEIMQQFKTIRSCVKNNFNARNVIQFFKKKKFKVTFVTFPIIRNTFEKNK